MFIFYINYGLDMRTKEAHKVKILRSNGAKLNSIEFVQQLQLQDQILYRYDPNWKYLCWKC